MTLASWEAGNGRPVLCLHETATSSEVWRPLAGALGDRARTIAPDRRGWGRSEAPEGYARTTIGEQSEDAATLLAERADGPAVVCGAGLGAVAALDLLLRRPELAGAALLVEPPLLAFVPEATEALSADRALLTEAVRDGGPTAGLSACLGGALPALGAGAERIPEPIAATAWERPMSLFAELGAVSAWELPLEAMAACRAPTRVILADSTPPLLRRAAEALVPRLHGAAVTSLAVDGLPHLDAAPELAELALSLIASMRSG